MPSPSPTFPGHRPEIVRRGPTAVSTMIAGFKEPTEKEHGRIPSNISASSVSVRACPILPNLAMRAPESSKATATVLCRHSEAECAQNLWTCKPRYPFEGQRTLPNSHMRHKQVSELNNGSLSCRTSMLPILRWPLPDFQEHRAALPPEVNAQHDLYAGS